MKNSQSQNWVIGISGASGTVYARRLIRALIEHEPEVTLEVVITDSALRVMREEENFSASIRRMSVEELIGFQTDRVTVHSNRDIGATIASGSHLAAGMVIIPCSMKTLAGVATGFCDTLLLRAADVTLKEGRKLVVVPRETPLSLIHLENMAKLARMGVSMVPAMPGFYHQPKSIDDLVDMMVMKVIDQMGYRIDLVERWKQKEPSVIDDTPTIERIRG